MKLELKKLAEDVYLIIDEESLLTLGMTVRMPIYNPTEKSCKLHRNYWTVSVLNKRNTNKQDFVELRNKTNEPLVCETPEDALREFFTHYL